MFKRMIVAVATLAAVFCLPINVEAVKPDQSSDKAIESLSGTFDADKFEYTARDAGSVGNGNGRPEKVLPIEENFQAQNPVQHREQPTVEIQDQTPVEPPQVQTPIQPAVEKNDEWLIYWYVCGTDIESDRIVPGNPWRPGDVTRCIREVEKANLSSDKVKLLMQAGGTRVWGHEKFKPNNGKIGHYLYDINNRDWTPLEPLTPITATMSIPDATEMSSKESLVNFLHYGQKMEEILYDDPAKIHRVFIFVDHGGGSLYGVCADAFTVEPDLPVTEYARMLELKDMRDAFKEVLGDSPQNPPFDVVAFDTCVMSTYETAVALEGTARYMVASQESIWGHVMFEYTGLLEQLSNNPTMNAENFGRIICDTYKDDTIRNRKFATLTISLVDISRMPKLEAAYENFGKELLTYAQSFQRPYSFITSFSTNSDPRNVEQYGLAMVDLKNIAENTKTSFSFSQRLNQTNNRLSASLKQACDDVIDALDGENKNGAVIYQHRGSDRLKGGGLSTYYSPSFESFDIYEELAEAGLAPMSQKELYRHMIKVSKGKNYSTSSGAAINSRRGTNALNPENTQGGFFDFSDLRNLQSYPDEDRNSAVLELTQEQMERVSAVRCQIALVRMAGNADFPLMRLIFLGGNTEVNADWKNGIFESAFSGKWITIDGQPVYVQVDSEATTKDENGNNISGSELYSIPIMLNDKGYNLLISCEYPEEKFSIIGARPMVEGSDPEAKNLSNTMFSPSAVNGEIRGLNAGDVIKPLYYVLDIPLELAFNPSFVKFIKDYREGSLKVSNADLEKIMEAFANTGFFNIYTSDQAINIREQEPEIKNQILPDAGLYAYMFELVNPIGGMNGSSQLVYFTLENGLPTICDNNYTGDKIDEMFVAQFGEQALKDFDKKWEDFEKQFKEIYGEELYNENDGTIPEDLRKVLEENN